MCCSSNQAAFAWIAATLVNLGFLSLISWGAATLWPLGCLLSALYTCFLFGLANWLESSDRRSIAANSSAEDETLRRPTSSDNDDNETDLGEDRHDFPTDSVVQQESTGAFSSREPGIANPSRKSFSVLVSVLYGLAVVSFGVTGFLLAINLVETCNDSASNKPNYYWKTNFTDLPKEVQSWAKKDTQNSPDMYAASFGYVESTGVTLFRGMGGVLSSAQSECLWATTQTGEPPIQHKEYAYPGPFVSVTSHAVCFQSEQGSATQVHGSEKVESGLALICSDGKTFARTSNSTRDPAGYLHSFKAFRGYLWFKKDITSTYRENESGTLIYSLDPETMIVSLYSTRVPRKDSGDGPDTPCDPDSVLHRQALWVLVASAIPMTALSMGLWKTKSISSMGSLVYISLSLVYISLHLALAPGSVENSDGPFFRWWFAISGAFFMLLSTYLLLSVRSSSTEETASFPFWLCDTENSPCLRLGLQTSALGFAYGASLLIMYADNGERDKLEWWILLNCVVFWPLLVLGAASDTTFLLVLCGLGLLADAARIAAVVDTEPLGVFLIFCCSGVLVGAMGYQLSRYQATIESAAKRLVKGVNQRMLSSGVVGLSSSEEVVEAADDTANEPLVTRV